MKAEDLKPVALRLTTVAIALIVAILLYVSFWALPVLLTQGRSNMSVTCGQVKPGMSSSEMIEVLHRHQRYGYEFFDGSQYTYYGSGGGCVVTIDSHSGRVDQAKFLAPNIYDLRAMDR